MTLGDLALPIAYEDAKQYALVFGDALSQRLAEVWQQYGSIKCVPTPSRLTDGRWMLCVDILTEIGPGGLLKSMWSNVDQAVVMANVEVIPWADAVAMLPVEPPLQTTNANTLPTGSVTINGSLTGGKLGR